MGDLDETSLIIGKLQGEVTALNGHVTRLESMMKSMEGKLDRALERQFRMRLSWKHWAAIIAGASAGGGGVAHALRRILE